MDIFLIHTTPSYLYLKNQILCNDIAFVIIFNKKFKNKQNNVSGSTQPNPTPYYKSFHIDSLPKPPILPPLIWKQDCLPESIIAFDLSIAVLGSGFKRVLKQISSSSALLFITSSFILLAFSLLSLSTSCDTCQASMLIFNDVTGNFVNEIKVENPRHGYKPVE